MSIHTASSIQQPVLRSERQNWQPVAALEQDNPPLRLLGILIREDDLLDRVRHMPLEPREKQFFHASLQSAKMSRVSGIFTIIAGVGIAVQALSQENNDRSLLFLGTGLTVLGLLKTFTAYRDIKKIPELELKFKTLKLMSELLQSTDQRGPLAG